MESAFRPFSGAYYSAAYRESMKNLAVPMWSAAELWGAKESPWNFRNCLVGTAEECASVWKRWRADGIFESDTRPTYYVLKQVFRFRGRTHERWGVFGTLSAVDGSVRVHEAVSPEGAENIKNRFRLGQADLTPIFVGIEEEYQKSLHERLQALVAGENPLLVYQESRTAYHVLWRVEDHAQRARIADFFTDKKFYLLDGHHRFRGAQDNFRQGHGDGRLMACVTTMAAEDLVILPIHRAAICEPWLLPELALKRLEGMGCEVVRRVRWSQETLLDTVFTTDWSEGDFYFLPTQSAELSLLKLPPASGLVVERVERDLFAKIPEASLLPVNDLQFLVDQLASGQAQAAVILPPIAASAVRTTADAGKVLPRKSTQFWPKPALGLVCRPWD